MDRCKTETRLPSCECHRQEENKSCAHVCTPLALASLITCLQKSNMKKYPLPGGSSLEKHGYGYDLSVYRVLLKNIKEAVAFSDKPPAETGVHCFCGACNPLVKLADGLGTLLETRHRFATPEQVLDMETKREKTGLTDLENDLWAGDD